MARKSSSKTETGGSWWILEFIVTLGHIEQQAWMPKLGLMQTNAVFWFDPDCRYSIKINKLANGNYNKLDLGLYFHHRDLSDPTSLSKLNIEIYCTMGFLFTQFIGTAVLDLKDIKPGYNAVVETPDLHPQLLKCGSKSLS